MNTITPTAQNYWWNFVTEQYDERDVPTTDEEAVQYIPQIGAAQKGYHLRRALGATVLEAILKTLEAVAP